MRRPELVLPLLRPYPSTDMAAYEVPPLVNDVRNEGTDLIVPLAPAEAQPRDAKIQRNTRKNAADAGGRLLSVFEQEGYDHPGV